MSKCSNAISYPVGAHVGFLANSQQGVITMAYLARDDGSVHYQVDGRGNYQGADLLLLNTVAQKAYCKCDIAFDDSESFDSNPAHDAATRSITRCLNQHLENHKTCGRDWPGDAEFCVVYKTSTWPCGWDKENSIQFFRTSDELNSWIQNKHDWAECEDNYFAFQAYQWDLGPNVMVGNCLNAGNL